ncbi:MAG: hypothetical protein ACRBBR_11240 [Cellvibrionaceae bacterium]
MDLDPKNNLRAVENVARFSLRIMLIFRPGFYYFLGVVLILFGLLAIFTQESTLDGQIENLNQQEVGLLSFSLGVLIISFCKLILWLSRKFKQC